MKRVLCLHGHFHSADYFKSKLDAIRDACRESIEFVFVDAPHVLSPVDLPGAASNDSLTVWSDINTNTSRAWWRYLYDVRDVSAVVESFHYIKNVLETQGPFEGILGFSQGACFAAMILAYMEHPHVMPHLLPDLKHPPFEFAVFISGFVAPTTAFPLPPMIHTPSLHVMGFNDIMVSPEMSLELAEHFDKPQIEMHEGGHFVPRKLTWRRFLSEYLNSRASTSVPALWKPIPAPTPAWYREKLPAKELRGSRSMPGLRNSDILAC
ncbi:serine hydrolase-domain-containing protein [Roridomyces roridus]|uniref:Serine hydrolase-domain-containing protein n=1 Tax=Roridomyces roridus TaxID=1738132 RepID=A0AAD7BHK7_9AGAR|nr:serine hydrolase-domain-containing protein [Roridomyces roridus]